MKEKTHWLQNPNKNYFGHWDLPDSGELLVTIKTAQWQEVKNPKNNVTQSKRVIVFEEDLKPFICNEVNAFSIMTVTGTRNLEDSPGSVICLHIAKDKVKGIMIDCVRVKAGLAITKKMVQTLWDSKEAKVPEKNKAKLSGIITGNKQSQFQHVFDYLSKL